MGFNDKGEVVYGQKYLDPDKTIGPGPEGLPKHGAPAGWKIMPDSMMTQQIIGISRSILGDPWGTILPFAVDGVEFLTRKEPHYHDPNSNWKNKGWHVGASVYVRSNASEKPSKINPQSEMKVPVQETKLPETKPPTQEKVPGSKVDFLARLDQLLDLLK